MICIQKILIRMHSPQHLKFFIIHRLQTNTDSVHTCLHPSLYLFLCHCPWIDLYRNFSLRIYNKTCSQCIENFFYLLSTQYRRCTSSYKNRSDTIFLIFLPISLNFFYHCFHISLTFFFPRGSRQKITIRTLLYTKRYMDIQLHFFHLATSKTKNSMYNSNIFHIKSFSTLKSKDIQIILEYDSV